MAINLPSHASIIDRFSVFYGGTGGIDSWLGAESPTQILDTLANITQDPLSRSRMNQLLTLARESRVSSAFYSYYWTTIPEQHPFDVRKIPYFSQQWIESDDIRSLDQLYWGLYRFYVDALLFFGNVRAAFRHLTSLSDQDLRGYFVRRRVNTDSLLERGDPIRPSRIAKDDRYLVSEMACKSFGEADVPQGELEEVLFDLYRQHRKADRRPVTPKDLLTGAYGRGDYSDRQLQFDLSADDIMEDPITSEEDLRRKIKGIVRKFDRARGTALENTKTYLSMVGDLDVYVATSMRIRSDFRRVADFCESVFEDPALQEYKLRYFDPTLSAADHHEDKGLIECLMVKCAKVLVLYAGESDSYGKDAEAAMALSLGKPVVIYAESEQRRRIFRDVHPLTRLINFESGVAIGAMIASSESEVVDLLQRIFANMVEYEIQQPHPRYLVLKEKTTDSVVRLQSSDSFLRDTFWNHYHGRDS